MKRLFTILCICFCFVPLFAFPSSAADYSFDYPKMFFYEGIGIPEKWLSVLEYDSSTVTLEAGSLDVGSKFGFGYYRNYESYSNSEYNGLWYLGDHGITSSDVFRNVRVPNFLEANLTLYFATTSNISSHLFYAQFVRENVLIPINGQYFKYELQFDSAIINAPNVVKEFIDLSTLCFFCDTSGIPGNASKYSLPKLLPSAAYKNTTGDVVKFTFYFDLTGNEFDVLRDSENVCFAVRIPYYFDGKSDWQQGVRLISNANIPGTYSILNVGGYEQELEDILSSVDSFKSDLFDLYTVEDRSDVLFLRDADSAFDEGKNVVDDYNNANDEIQQIVSDFVMPDMQDIIDEQVGLTGEVMVPVKEIFQNTYIVSAFLICFAFCLISVLLYGIRG